MKPQIQSLRPFRAGYWFGGFNGLTWMMSLGTPMVLLLEQLGGSSFQVGLASSFVYLLYPIQVLATAMLERLGFRHQMVLGWGARAFFLLVPLGLAWLAPGAPDRWMANALVLSVFLFCVCRAFGGAAHIPWLAAILPEPLRGRFFATEGAITSAVGVLALLTCTGLFAALPTYVAFRWVYGIAIFGSAAAVLCLLRLPAGPRPAPSPIRHMMAEAVGLSLRPGLFRHYLMFELLSSVAIFSFGAFTSYYLKAEVGLASSAIMSFTAATFAGRILGSLAIRHWIDRVVIRCFFQSAHLVFVGVFLFWLAVVRGEVFALTTLGASYFAFGVAAGVGQAAHMTFLPEISPMEKRPVALAVFGAVTGVVSGVAPMLWGLALRTGGAQPGVDIGNFTIYFGLGAGLSTLVLVLLPGLPDPRGHTSRQPSGDRRYL
ncbi:MAG: hypothetical protein OEZ06_11005 [Myxococcales bacterium]|nr:hypothetical protein [Myxococcales bacterium]